MTAHFRPRLAIVVAAVGLVASLAPSAWSQPVGTIKIVVPYTPGSGPDILSRLMAEQIGRAQGPTVVVENRPGGGTVIGTEAVERAEPDGHTVLLVANSFVANPALKRASYDPTRSFEPVCYLAATPMVLVVLASSPYRTLNDLITAARARPGELAFASGGPGSSLHVAIEVLKRAANINVTYVPYGGTAPAINALMGNHVAAVWADYPTVVSQLSSGALRGLVTTSRTRVEALPEVPTLIETGISNYEADIFYGIVDRGARENTAGNGQSIVRLAHRRAQSSRHETQAGAARAVSGRYMRCGIRRLSATAGRRLHPHHPRGEYHGQIAPRSSRVPDAVQRQALA
jgi:tripartite-type tricarboxylate transporter receptor subunit TctC